MVCELSQQNLVNIKTEIKLLIYEILGVDNIWIFILHEDVVGLERRTFKKTTYVYLSFLKMQ